MTPTLVNGMVADAVPIGDRGLQYGDGLFETVCIVDGRPELWNRHLGRMRLGCQRLRIPVPDADLLRGEVADLCVGVKRGVLKLIVTRGVGGRGYRLPERCSPNRILALYSGPDYPAEYARDGVCVRICRHRLATNPPLAGLKHLNRLDQVLGRSEWDDPDIAEGLMLDRHGRVVEGTISNLFLVTNGRLVTPAITRCGVAGIMRGLIVEIAEELDIRCEMTSFHIDTVNAADEVFLCNSLIGIWPVRTLETRLFDAPGPVTQRIRAAVQEARRK